MSALDDRLDVDLETALRSYRGRRALVTGHTGFKGGWLSVWLAELGADVTGYALDPPTDPSLFDRAGIGRLVRDERGDIRDIARFGRVWQRAAPDVVFHLAAQPIVRESYRLPLETLETNVMGTAHVLELARSDSRSVPLVLITSDKCYENREWTLGYRETDRLGGRDPYSASKAAAEIVIDSYRRSFFEDRGLVASVRAGNVIGGGDWARDRIVPDSIRALAAGRSIEVRHPDAVRPWQHVLEPLSGYLMVGSRLLSSNAAVRAGAAQAWNFGPDDENSLRVRDVVEALVREWGGGSWRVVETGAHEPTLLRLATDRARAYLGWWPRWGFDDTIARTVAWYKASCAGGDALSWCRRQIEEYCAEAREAGAGAADSIDGVRIVPLDRVTDARGSVLKMLRADAPHFAGFGEIYFSTVTPGEVKGWNRHTRMTVNLAVPAGTIRLVLFDERSASPTRGRVMDVRVGGPDDNLVVIPPGIWAAFASVGDGTALVANCASLPHDPGEVERADPHGSRVPFTW